MNENTSLVYFCNPLFEKKREKKRKKEEEASSNNDDKEKPNNIVGNPKTTEHCG